MADVKQNSVVKALLEFGPIVVFFIAYKYAPLPDLFEGDESLERIIFATKAFIPTILATVLFGYFQTKTVAKMPLFTAVIVLVFGGLTIWLRDETFIKMKPTITYLVFAFLLGIGLLRGRSYLKSLMAVALPMEDEGWMILTKRFILFFIILAIANEYIWRSFNTDIWVNFKTFGLPISTFIFFFSQARLIQKHRIEDPDNS